jgi:VCBS repeat-containing protein
MGANTTKQVAWLTGAAKDDSLNLLAGSTGALVTKTFALSSMLANDPGSASFYGVYATATPYKDASTKTPLASATTSGTSLGGTVTVNKTTGVVTYNPPATITDAVLKALPAGATINDSFYYVIWMADKGAYSLAVATVKLTGIDDAATITGTSSGSVVEDATVLAAGTLSITDPDTGESGFNAASMAGAYGTLTLTPGTTGTDVIPGTASWSYSLDHDLANSLKAGEEHTETFTLLSKGGTAVTVTITVTGTNDGPTAVADAATTSENASVTIDVVANDTDPDHDHVLSLVSVDGVTGGGGASAVDGQVAFDPGADFDHLADGDSASVTIAYTIQDEHGAQSSSSVTVTVTGENDGPTANGDSATTDQNTAVAIAALANDTDPDDHHTLSMVSIDGAPAGGGVTIDEDGNVVFDPGSDFAHLADGTSETVTFGYTITDEHGAQSSATIEVVVNGLNDAATMDGIYTGSVTEDGTLVASGYLEVDDVDDGEDGFAAVADAALHGTYGEFHFDGGTGGWSYTLRNDDATVQALDTGEHPTDSLTINSIDGTASETITITVNGVDEPVVVNLSTSYHVNHGLDTLNGRYNISGFDGNDVLQYAKDLSYGGATTADANGDGAMDTLVTFTYNKDDSSGTGGGKGGNFESFEVVLLGYTGFDPATQLQ